MAVKDTTATPAEVLTYNGLFLNDLRMTQIKAQDDAAPPQYAVNIMYRRYAVDSAGKRHYQSEAKTLTVQDFLAEAETQANAGDLTLMAAITSLQSAFAKMVEDAEGITTVEV